MVVLALAIPFAGVALAGHNTTHTLDCEPETDQNPTGQQHTITCTVSGATASSTQEVDFEIVGPGDPSNDAFDPTPPDYERTCQTQAADDAGTPIDDTTQCVVTLQYTSQTAGADEITAWIDDDRNDTTFDADATEEQAEGTAGNEGDISEPDDTDVVAKTWFQGIPGDATLDCEPETAVNPIGEDEAYLCTVTTADSADAGDERDPVAGVVVDAENLGGANDPDNGATAPPDYTCTTNDQGQCTILVNADENQAGSALICAYVDEDTDNEFNQGGTDPADGGRCDVEPRDETALGVGQENNARTDVVEKTWATAGSGAGVDAEPELDNNPSGTQHTVTATVTDVFGDPVAGQVVDFEITGRNGGRPCDNVVTNNQGVATCTYQDTGDVNTSGADTICVFLEGNTNDNTPGEPAGEDCTEARAEDDNDQVDVVTKFWTAGGFQVNQVRFDADADGEPCPTVLAGVVTAGDFDEDAGNNDVGDIHTTCAVVLDADGNPIPGAPVTFTTNHGNFVDDQGTATPADDEDLGQSITVVTNEEGQAFADLTSDEAGTATITATSGNRNDTGTKTFVALEGRNVDCEPETASNAPGTQHVVTCTVTDRFGNPVENAQFDFSETGPGRIVTEENTTDANGQAEAVVETTQNEQGDQTITGSLAGLTTGANNDECEQAANQPNQGDPAGNCADTVTKTWEPQVGPPQCSDGVDNADPEDTLADENDPGCLDAGGNYNPNDNDETDPAVDGPTRGPCQGFPFNSRTPKADGSGLVIVGSPENDILVGTDGDDTICALGGDDQVDALEGQDQVAGNAGADEIDGGRGKDQLKGGRGRDIISGRGGNDTIAGGAGNDTLKGNKGIDGIRGEDGNDTIQGGSHQDTLIGGTGADVLRGWTGDDVIKGGGGHDIINGHRGFDICRGGRGNNVIRNCER